MRREDEKKCGRPVPCSPHPETVTLSRLSPRHAGHCRAYSATYPSCCRQCSEPDNGSIIICFHRAICSLYSIADWLAILSAAGCLASRSANTQHILPTV